MQAVLFCLFLQNGYPVITDKKCVSLWHFTLEIERRKTINLYKKKSKIIKYLAFLTAVLG
ncbi:hypothetical protein A6B43_03120 [Vespertiliibacter pulmonis]|nr:hypothetical protein A6B43_03120 [Vespertiliibacter pulmonis]